MDVKSGTTVGFITVLGGAAGVVAGLVVSELTSTKRPDQITTTFGAIGALVGAFMGGTIVASAPSTSTSMVATPSA